MFRQFILTSVCILTFAGSSVAEIAINRDSNSDPSTLDQHHSSTVQEGWLLGDLYEGLVTRDDQGAVIAGVAKSWDISPDGLTYTFRLRDDAKWSNGEPVTADDFLFSLRRIMNPQTAAGYASVLYPIRMQEWSIPVKCH